MQGHVQYGPRLTGAEYERKLLSLHGSLPALPSPEQDREVRRQELELAIDYRLGRDFPAERRSALWAVQERIEEKRLRLGLTYFLRRLAAKLLFRDAHSLAAYAVEEYGRVLSPEELRCFLDLKEGEEPALPVDVEHCRR